MSQYSVEDLSIVPLTTVDFIQSNMLDNVPSIIPSKIALQTPPDKLAIFVEHFRCWQSATTLVSAVYLHE